MNRRAPADRAMMTMDSVRVEVGALQAALAASQARTAAAEAKVSDAQAQIAALTLMIEKLRRALYGRRSERSERILGQLELELDELTSERHRGRSHGRDGDGPDHQGQGVRATQALTQTLPRASAARARGGAHARLVHVLRVAAAVEGRP